MFASEELQRWAGRLCLLLVTAFGTMGYHWANVRFLRGFGFEVTSELRTADDELPLWVLVRQPQPRFVG